MRVALVLAGPYPALRGSQVLVRHLAEGLRERQHIVHLVTYGPGPAGRPGPTLARLARDLALVARLWRTVYRAAIDVIHGHNYEAAIAGLIVGRLTGRPLVYHGHNALGEELPMYFRGRLARWLARRLGQTLDSQVPRRADFCIAVTEQLGHVLRRRGVREDGLAWIAPAGRPAEIGAPPGRTASSGLICYAGNLDAYQNLAFLLRSFERVRARLPGARLVVVTHADPGVRHDALGRSGVEVVWAASYDEVQGRLAAADVAVSPRAERSGFPMKLLNYMAAGKAIVASAGSAKGLVDGVTARIVPDGDEEAFAAAVIELLEDRVLRERLGAAARAAIEDVAAWETVLDRIESVYAQVVVPARARATIVGRAGVVGVGAGVEKE